jgi:hypothetical protein
MLRARKQPQFARLKKEVAQRRVASGKKEVAQRRGSLEKETLREEVAGERDSTEKCRLTQSVLESFVIHFHE